MQRLASGVGAALGSGETEASLAQEASILADILDRKEDKQQEERQREADQRAAQDAYDRAAADASELVSAAKKVLVYFTWYTL